MAWFSLPPCELVTATLPVHLPVTSAAHAHAAAANRQMSVRIGDDTQVIGVWFPGNQSTSFSASSPCSTMSPGLNSMSCSTVLQSDFCRSRNSRSMPKCLNSSFCAFRMMARAALFFSTEMRCSYQLMASASSIIETIIRAKVRVFSESSEAGSWDCSNPIMPILPPRHALPRHRFHRVKTASVTGPRVVIALHGVGIRAPCVQELEQGDLSRPVGFFGGMAHFARLFQHVRFEVTEHRARDGVLLLGAFHFRGHRGTQRGEPRFELAVLEARALDLALIAV